MILLFFALPPAELDIVNTLFIENNKHLYNIAYKFLHSNALAEEAVQESFIKIIKNVEKITAIPSPQRKGYCVTIVKRTCIDMIRKNKLESTNNELENIPDADRNIEQAYISAEEKTTLMASIDTLSEDDKALVLMRWSEGFSYSKIALLLGINEDTAKKRGQRVLKKLKKDLKERGYGYE